MLAIASLAFREVLRKKILILALALTLAFLALYGTGLHYVGLDLYRENANPVAVQMATAQLFSVGLYLGGLVVSLLAILSAAGTLSTEIENGTMHAIATKPMLRREIVLGKFVGYAVMMSLYSIFFYLGLTGLVQWKLHAQLSHGFVQGMMLFTLQPLVLLSVTMLGTASLSTLSNGVVVMLFYAISIIGGMVEQVGAILDNTILVYSGIICSLVMPSDALYRRIVSVLMPPSAFPAIAVQHMGPFGSLAPPSNAMLIYTVLYIAAALFGSIMVFERRDI